MIRVGHDLIRCRECDQAVRACGIYLGQHGCSVTVGERYLLSRLLYARLDSGEFLEDTKR